MSGGKLVDPPHHFIEAAASIKRGREQRAAIRHKMPVSIDKPRIDRLPSRVHRLRSRILPLNIGIRTHSKNLSILHGQRLRLAKNTVDGIDFCMIDDKVCGLFVPAGIKEDSYQARNNGIMLESHQQLILDKN